MGSNFFDIGHRCSYLGMSPKSRETKAKNNPLRLHHNKKLLYSEGNPQQNDRQLTEWEKIVATNIYKAHKDLDL